MHREVAGSQSNHEIFPYLKTTIILLGCFLYKNDFFAGYGNIVQNNSSRASVLRVLRTYWNPWNMLDSSIHQR